jgi:Asp-tRNA(Asn)/Glu-tRNA(Gln) amidotransferase A subunit family amidase
MQIVTKAWDEQTAFNVGHAYQNVTDWHTHAPDFG